jgi:hypothetical protein
MFTRTVITDYTSIQRSILAPSQAHLLLCACSATTVPLRLRCMRTMVYMMRYIRACLEPAFTSSSARASWPPQVPWWQQGPGWAWCRRASWCCCWCWAWTLLLKTVGGGGQSVGGVARRTRVGVEKGRRGEERVKMR